MADIITYNNIISVFQDISERHYQINTFFVGDSWEEDAGTVVYPLLAINPTGANMNKGDNGYATFEITMNVVLSDLVYKGKENENEIISDTLQIIQDIIVEFNQHPYYTNSRFDISNDLSFTPFTERNDDEVSGWQVEMVLRTPNIREFCGIPVSEINGFEFDRPSCGTNGAVGTTCLCIKTLSGLNPIQINESNGEYTWALKDNFITGSSPIVVTETIGDYDITFDDPLNYVASTGGSFTGEITFDNEVNFDDNVSFQSVSGSFGTAGTLDLSTGNIFIYEFPNATTVDYTNAQIGSYQFIFNGQTTSSAITFSSGKWQQASAQQTIALTATAGAVDMFSAIYDGTKLIIVQTENIVDI